MDTVSAKRELIVVGKLLFLGLRQILGRGGET